MTLKERTDLLSKLGAYLASEDEFLQAVLHRVAHNNAWLTKKNSLRAAKALGTYCLNPSSLNKWATFYHVSDSMNAKKVGLVLSSQEPFDGLVDIAAIFLIGHQAVIKLSEEDEYTIPHLVKMMAKWNPASASYFQIAGFLKGFDAIIASKSGKENPYFERYFGKYPHILRTNQSSIAVLTGAETDANLVALGDDICAYYGLTKESVSKIYVPNNYDLNHLLEILHEHKEMVLNSRYKNNFDYNYSLYLLNNEPFKANGCLLLIEDPSIESRIACLHYEYYDNQAHLQELIKNQQEHIHQVVSEQPLGDLPTKRMGTSHIPDLFTYAGAQDTMQFLLSL